MGTSISVVVSDACAVFISAGHCLACHGGEYDRTFSLFSCGNGRGSFCIRHQRGIVANLRSLNLASILSQVPRLMNVPPWARTMVLLIMQTSAISKVPTFVSPPRELSRLLINAVSNIGWTMELHSARNGEWFGLQADPTSSPMLAMCGWMQPISDVSTNPSPPQSCPSVRRPRG